MSVVVLRGDAAHLPLPDESVDLLVTSPPYYSLRDYRDAGESMASQIGAEATPAEYVAALVACTREWTRVLKPSGSIFAVLGDKYANDAKWGGATSGKHVNGLHGQTGIGRAKVRTGFPAKSLMMLPQRYAIRCIDDLGLILRAEIIWQKVNGLPESVQDRVRRSHETILHLVKQPRYYSAVDEIREPHQPQSIARTGRKYTAGDLFSVGTPNTLDPAQFCNPLGKLPGSVWEIANQPLNVPAELGVGHFAAYPPDLVRRIILGWSPAGVCTECGEGRRPVAILTGEEGRRPGGRSLERYGSAAGELNGGAARTYVGLSEASLKVREITGYACACTPYTDYPERRRPSVTPSRELRQDQDIRTSLGLSRHHGNDFPDRQPVREYDFDGWTPAPTRPAIVLDPFAGTGTTMLVADALGRIGVGVDRSWDYCRLARWRTTDPAERARAMQVPKPPVEVTGQADLFTGDVAS